jgi:hypothetical protein
MYGCSSRHDYSVVLIDGAGIEVVKNLLDQYADFQSSMAEMIVVYQFFGHGDGRSTMVISTMDDELLVHDYLHHR